MGVYSETIYVMDPDGSEHYEDVIYYQPTWRHVWYVVVRVISRAIDPVLHRVDQLLERRHMRTCANDCGDGFRVSDAGDEIPVRICVRFPLCARLDLYVENMNLRERYER